MRCAVLALSLVGCNQIYGLDPTQLDDLEPPKCSTVRFNAPRSIPEFLDDGPEYDAQLSSDGNELWLVTTTTAGYGIHRGARATADQQFILVWGGLLDETVSTTDPALTADGRRMMFIAEGNGRQLYEGVRADPTAFPFDRILAVTGFGQFPNGVELLDLSWDGLRIYFTAEGGVLYVATRKTRDTPFGIATVLIPDANAEFLTVSGDELEIFYNRYKDPIERLYRRERADRADAFGPEELVLDEGGDPDISPSSSTLIVSRDNGLYILDRVCPR